MKMPEASVHKNCLAHFPEHDIWSSRQIAAVKPVPIAHSVNQSPDGELRFCIRGPYQPHPVASLTRRHDIHRVLCSGLFSQALPYDAWGNLQILVIRNHNGKPKPTGCAFTVLTPLKLGYATLNEFRELGQHLLLPFCARRLESPARVLGQNNTQSARGLHLLHFRGLSVFRSCANVGLCILPFPHCNSRTCRRFPFLIQACTYPATPGPDERNATRIGY